MKLLPALLLLIVPATAQAQLISPYNPYGVSPYGTSPYGVSPYGQTPYGVMPYSQSYYPPVQQNTNVLATPWGYQSRTTTASPYGITNNYSSGTIGVPYVRGPMHSVWFDPVTRTYRYSTGTQNTPVIQYQTNRFYP